MRCDKCRFRDKQTKECKRFPPESRIVRRKTLIQNKNKTKKHNGRRYSITDELVIKFPTVPDDCYCYEFDEEIKK